MEITPMWHACAMADRLTRLVVDSPSLFYRAFFALPASIKGPDGNSVNAIRGYLDMVSRVLIDRRPEAVANVFDADWRPQWRVDLDAMLAAAAAGRLTPRLNATLTASADYVTAMRKVAAVATDVDYRISDPHPPDRDRLAALGAAHAIEGPVERMLAAMEQAGLADPAPGA